MLIYYHKIRNSRKRNFQYNGVRGSIVGQAALFVHTFMDKKKLVWGLVMKGHWHIRRACPGSVGHVCSTLPKTDFLQTNNHRLRGRDLLEQFPPSSPTQMGATHIESEESRMLRSWVHFNIIAQSYYTAGIVIQTVRHQDHMRSLPARAGVNIM